MSVVIVQDEAVAEQSIEAETEAKVVSIKLKAKPEPSPPSEAESNSDEIEIPKWIKQLKQSPAASALERLFAQQVKVRARSLDLERKTKLAKAAKSKLETEQDVLSQIFEELSINPDEWLPFGEDKDEDDSEDVEIEADDEEDGREDVETIAWSRYRELPIDQLEAATAKVKESLRDARIMTLGDLDDHLRDGKFLTGIPGIGEAKAEKLLDEKITLFQRVLAETEADFAGRTSRQAAAAQD